MNTVENPKLVDGTWNVGESLVAQVVESVADAIVLIDRNRIVTFANAAAERILGVPVAELVGTPWRKRRWRATLSDGQPVPLEQQADKRTLDDGEPNFGLERLIVRPDGSQVLISGNTVPLRDGHGDVVGMVISLTDITYRTQAEQELRRREEYFRALVEHSSDATAVVDETGRVLYLTPSAERINGYAAAEWLGRNGFDMVHPDDLERARRIFTQVVADPARVSRYVLRIRHKNGEWRHMEIVLSNRLADPAVHALVANFRDVTDQEEAAAALRRSEERYRVLFERNLAGVFRSRMDGTLLDCNDAFARVFGCASRAEMLSVNTHEFDRSSDDRQKFADALMAQGSLTNYESPMRRRDGTPIWILENVVLRREGGDTVQEGTVIDVTEHRRTEEQLRQASKMEAFGQLAGGVAHDFNNLLTALLGNLSLAMNRLPADHPSRELLVEAERAGWRAAELTGQLLGFARRRSLRLEPIHVLRGVAETVSILKRTLDPRISLEINSPPDLWPVLADTGQMNQVVLNLCLNARDAMPQGGRITLEAANVTLDDIAAARNADAQPGRFVRVSVRDTGHGMTEEIRRRVFEPFFTTKPPGKGTGLGLAMVFGILRQHGGWVECKSEPGQGTCFDVFLPRSERPTPGQRLSDTRTVGGNETILLVDDEPMIRSLGKTLLLQTGYRVLLAEDGPTAVELYREAKNRIDLVILDLTMPQMSGRDTFQELRRLDPKVKVIFSSGFAAESLTDEMSADATGFVSKPYRPNDLTRAVRAALDGTNTVTKPV